MTTMMPTEPPEDLKPATGEKFDEVLFDLCRRDDYAGLYREFIRRYGQPVP